MKAFYKITVIIFAAILALSFSAGAAESKYAKALYEIGIIRGTDKGFESDRTLTRAEAAAVIVRLLGEEESIVDNEYKEVFADVPRNHWAFGYVMYCYDNKITYGTGNNAFSPDNEIDARQFTALVMRAMGYDIPFENTMDVSVEHMLFNSRMRHLLESRKFTREDMFYVVYRCLKSERNDGTVMADYLAKKGVITQKEASYFDVYNNFETIDDLIDSLME